MRYNADQITVDNVPYFDGKREGMLVCDPPLVLKVSYHADGMVSARGKFIVTSQEETLFEVVASVVWSALSRQTEYDTEPPDTSSDIARIFNTFREAWRDRVTFVADEPKVEVVGDNTPDIGHG